MCGIVGFWGSAHNVDLNITCRKMVQQLLHRGPDDAGVWVQDNYSLAFGHARLSIQDLSPAGHQPMHSQCERYVLIFNGEIYNHINLRKQIESAGFKPGWQGHSDTETLLVAIKLWGVVEALKRCVGMFALAVWDHEDRSLILARDRVGEKPLYYGWQNNTFMFSSELKALKVHPLFKNEINRDALCLLLRHNTISAPYSIYKDIFKLLPGCMLTLNANEREPKISSYWDFTKVAEEGVRNPFKGTDQEAILELENVLSLSVSEQMMADVPLGAFLSGGVDSSTVVALMQTQSQIPVQTFSIGFNEQGYDEAKYAKEVAQYLGTDHTEFYVTSTEALEVIPKLPSMYDEPFSDSSQIPTYLVSSLAKQHVTVSLSGDGGDELFGGYNRHFRTKNIWNKIKYFPLPMRRFAAFVITLTPPQFWNQSYNLLSSIIPSRYQVHLPEDKMRKLSGLLAADSPESMYLNLVSHWKDPERIVINSIEPLTSITDNSRWPSVAEFENKMMFQDTVTYLPDDILTKVDRAAMSVSLETRIPMLDHRVIEFAWRLPLDMKIRGGEGKWLLRQLLYKYVPKELIDRPKMGFGVPIDLWLRGPLRDWCEELFDESRLRREGYFNHVSVRKKWDEHLSGKRNWQYQLWDILMFQAWLEAS